MKLLTFGRLAASFATRKTKPGLRRTPTLVGAGQTEHGSLKVFCSCPGRSPSINSIFWLPLMKRSRCSLPSLDAKTQRSSIMSHTPLDLSSCIQCRVEGQKRPQRCQPEVSKAVIKAAEEELPKGAARAQACAEESLQLRQLPSVSAPPLRALRW